MSPTGISQIISPDELLKLFLFLFFVFKFVLRKSLLYLLCYFSWRDMNNIYSSQIKYPWLDQKEMIPPTPSLGN